MNKKFHCKPRSDWINKTELLKKVKSLQRLNCKLNVL